MQLPLVIDRYQLARELATGGMATVYLGRARGAASFARLVAVKRLHPQFARDPEFVAMLVDEARIAARIRHHNVVPTLDVVSWHGELFVVMDYVHGEALAAIRKEVARQETTIPVPIVVAIVCDVLRGLHAAHEATDEHDVPLQIVHRDVSPQNILVGIDGVARVLDFGVSKAVGRLQSTSEGQIKGKAGYMAPEQLRGIADRRCDVYGTSVVLWELLTGKRLFVGASQAEVIANVIAHDIPAPSTLADVPPELEELVMCGLEREPSDRFATARDMERALARAVRPADAAEVAEWMTTTMKEPLSEKAKLMALVERESSEPARPLGRNADDVQTTPVNATHSVLATRRSRRPALLIAGIAVAALGGTIIATKLRSEAHAAPSAPPETKVTAQAAIPLPSTSASASAAPIASNKPAGSASTTTELHPRHTGPPTAASKRPSCNPPYYIDSQGIQRWYPECL